MDVVQLKAPRWFTRSLTEIVILFFVLPTLAWASLHFLDCNSQTEPVQASLCPSALMIYGYLQGVPRWGAKCLLLVDFTSFLVTLMMAVTPSYYSKACFPYDVQL